MELHDDMVYLAQREQRYKEQSHYSQCACIHPLEPSPKKCNASAQYLRWQGIYNYIDVRQKKFDQKIEDITYLSAKDVQQTREQHSPTYKKMQSVLGGTDE